MGMQVIRIPNTKKMSITQTKIIVELIMKILVGIRV